MENGPVGEGGPSSAPSVWGMPPLVLSLLSQVPLQAGFRSRPVLGRLREFFIRLRLMVKKNIILEFLKTEYELSKTRSNTCPSACRLYFLFTFEKTSNDVKFHVVFVNY